MQDPVPMHVIATMRSAFPDKFGIPRRAAWWRSCASTIVFQPAYRNPDALRGLEGFSHLWVVWVFSQSARQGWSPTVRPPRLGGNTRMGVFATRSPFRPNPIGLSCVKIHQIQQDPRLGPVIHVLGADLMDGTPILGPEALHPHRRPPRGGGGVFGGPSPGAFAGGVPPRTCWPPCPRRTGPPWKECWPRIPGPPTRPTPSGCTACPSREKHPLYRGRWGAHRGGRGGITRSIQKEGPFRRERSSFPNWLGLCTWLRSSKPRGSPGCC